MSRKDQTNALKIRVMKVALNHFSEVGIENVSVSSILAGADCSVGSFYHHFGNKEGIAEAVLLEGVNQFNSGLLAALLPKKTASTGIKAIVTFCCNWVSNQSKLAAFMMSQKVILSDSFKSGRRKMDLEFNQAIYEWFVPHVDCGNLLRLPSSLYMPLICGPTMEYSRLWLSGISDRSPDDVSSVLAEAAWQSVKKVD